MNDEIPIYNCDDDTHKLLQTVLELALMSANLQIDQKNVQSVMDIVFTTAARFGIQFEFVEQQKLLPEPSLNLDDLPFDIQVSFIDEE